MPSQEEGHNDLSEKKKKGFYNFQSWEWGVWRMEVPNKENSLVNQQEVQI